MDDQLREFLAALIADHGRHVCRDPRTLGHMLREGCPQSGVAIHELELALQAGCVEPMLSGLPEHADGPALVQKLMDSSGLPMDRAQWVIESWMLALMRERPESSGMQRDWSQWNRLDVSRQVRGGAGLYQRSMASMAIVAAAAALGGAAFGLGTEFRADWRAAEFFKEAVGDLPEWAQSLSLIVLGLLGGGAGGLLGWMLGGGDAFGGSAAARLGLASLAALILAGLGAVGGFAAIGLIGAPLGALLGGLFGVFVGVMAADALARFGM